MPQRLTVVLSGAQVLPRELDGLRSRPKASDESCPSALIRAAHHLHRRFDVTPLLGVVAVALALALLRLLGGLRDRLKTVLLEHLARDGVDLHLRNHVALLLVRPIGKPQR